MAVKLLLSAILLITPVRWTGQKTRCRRSVMKTALDLLAAVSLQLVRQRFLTQCARQTILQVSNVSREEDNGIWALVARLIQNAALQHYRRHRWLPVHRRRRQPAHRSSVLASVRQRSSPGNYLTTAISVRKLINKLACVPTTIIAVVLESTILVSATLCHTNVVRRQRASKGFVRVT